MAINIEKALKNLAERRGCTVEQLLAPGSKSRLASLYRRRYMLDEHGNPVTPEALKERFEKKAAKEHGMMEHKGKTLPREVVSLAHRIEKKEPDYGPEKAYPTAWKIYEKHVPEGARYHLQSGEPKKYAPVEKHASKRDNAHLALAGAAALGSLASAVGANRAASVREKEYRQKYAMWAGFDKRAGLFTSIKPGFDPAHAGLLGRARFGLTSGGILPLHEYDDSNKATGRVGGYVLLGDKGHITHLDHPKLKRAIEGTPEGRKALEAFHAHREKRAAHFSIPHGDSVPSVIGKLRNLMGKNKPHLKAR